MGLRLWRRIKIAPGVTLNVSKRGLSTSFGPKGAKVTLGRGQIRKTVGLPGTGLFYTSTSKLGFSKPTRARGGTECLGEPRRRPSRAQCGDCVGGSGGRGCISNRDR